MSIWKSRKGMREGDRWPNEKGVQVRELEETLGRIDDVDNEEAA